MRTAPRFYLDAPLVRGQTLHLDAAITRHIQALRLQPGDKIQLFNGQGGTYHACIKAIARKTVAVDILAFDPSECETTCAVHLFVGAPTNERMDWLVEKATELGAASIHPMLTERSVLKLSGVRAQKRRDHWQAIAIAACEQSGRNRVPTVLLPAPLSACIQQAQGAYLCLSLASAARPLDSIPKNTTISVFSGPEGGFSADEETQLTAAGAYSISLGKRTLRAETAPIAALSRLVL